MLTATNSDIVLIITTLQTVIVSPVFQYSLILNRIIIYDDDKKFLQEYDKSSI